MDRRIESAPVTPPSPPVLPSTPSTPSTPITAPSNGLFDDLDIDEHVRTRHLPVMNIVSRRRVLHNDLKYFSIPPSKNVS